MTASSAGAEPGRGGAGPPRWVLAGAMLFAVAGLAVSVYLTVAHYTATVTLACPTSGTVNCEKVTSSPQSQLAGVPVAVLGLGFFAAMIALGVPAAWRTAHRWVHLVRLLAATGGIGFVLYLIYAELFLVDAICLWCTVVHLLTFGLFAVTALGNATADTAQVNHTGPAGPPKNRGQAMPR